MLYARVTKDGEVGEIGQVSVKQIETTESEEFFTLDFIDTVLQGIDGRIAGLTIEKETWETKRAAVLTEAGKVKLAPPGSKEGAL